MLLSKLWSRTAAGAAAVILCYYLLRNLHLAPSLDQALSTAHDSIYGSFVHGSSPRLEDDTVQPSSYTISGPATAESTGNIVDLLGAIDKDPEADRVNEATEPPDTSRPGRPPATGNLDTPSPKSDQNRTKAIVMGKMSTEDTDWVGENLKDWQHAIYVVDLPPKATSTTGLRTKVNKCKEAMPYLTYIIDRYPDFPDVSVFIHSHREGYPAAWHNDVSGHDAVRMVSMLRMDTVLKRGFVNLRCQYVPGCPSEIRINDGVAEADKRGTEKIFPHVYADFFDMRVEDVFDQVPIVASPCCAQFAVSRAQLLSRPKSAYEHYRNYIEKSTYSEEDLGTAMEYMWHIMFGQEPVFCQDPTECYAEVYGRQDGVSVSW